MHAAVAPVSFSLGEGWWGQRNRVSVGHGQTAQTVVTALPSSAHAGQRGHAGPPAGGLQPLRNPRKARHHQ